MIRIFDNQGKTIDRYTVVIIDETEGQEHVFTMSANQGPQGFNQYVGTFPEGDSEPSADEVELNECPSEIYEAVHRRMHQGA
jgi:hypothetical protein